MKWLSINKLMLHVKEMKISTEEGYYQIFLRNPEKSKMFPPNPKRAYGKDFPGWRKFLGVGKDCACEMKKYEKISFLQAREYVSHFGPGTYREWQKFAKSEYMLPIIHANPARYSDYKGMSSWWNLSSGKKEENEVVNLMIWAKRNKFLYEAINSHATTYIFNAENIISKASEVALLCVRKRMEYFKDKADNKITKARPEFEVDEYFKYYFRKAFKNRMEDFRDDLNAQKRGLDKEVLNNDALFLVDKNCSFATTSDIESRMGLKQTILWIIKKLKYENILLARYFAASINPRWKGNAAKIEKHLRSNMQRKPGEMLYLGSKLVKFIKNNCTEESRDLLDLLDKNNNHADMQSNIDNVKNEAKLECHKIYGMKNIDGKKMFYVLVRVTSQLKNKKNILINVEKTLEGEGKLEDKKKELDALIDTDYRNALNVVETTKSHEEAA